MTGNKLHYILFLMELPNLHRSKIDLIKFKICNHEIYKLHIVYGLRDVGKSYIVKQVCKEIQNDSMYKHHSVYYIDTEGVTNSYMLQELLQLKFGQEKSVGFNLKTYLRNKCHEDEQRITIILNHFGPFLEHSLLELSPIKFELDAITNVVNDAATFSTQFIFVLDTEFYYTLTYLSQNINVDVFLESCQTRIDGLDSAQIGMIFEEFSKQKGIGWPREIILELVNKFHPRRDVTYSEVNKVANELRRDNVRANGSKFSNSLVFTRLTETILKDLATYEIQYHHIINVLKKFAEAPERGLWVHESTIKHQLPYSHSITNQCIEILNEANFLHANDRSFKKGGYRLASSALINTINELYAALPKPTTMTLRQKRIAKRYLDKDHRDKFTLKEFAKDMYRIHKRHRIQHFSDDVFKIFKYVLKNTGQIKEDYFLQIKTKRVQKKWVNVTVTICVIIFSWIAIKLSDFEDKFIVFIEQIAKQY